MRIKRFEDLEIWQKSKELAVILYRETSIQQFAKDWGLRDQIRRAAVSISSNIAEGFERGSRKDFIRFLNIAKGSCGEVRSQLQIAYDLSYINERTYKDIYATSVVLIKQIASFIKYLKSLEQK